MATPKVNDKIIKFITDKKITDIPTISSLYEDEILLLIDIYELVENDLKFINLYEHNKLKIKKTIKDKVSKFTDDIVKENHKKLFDNIKDKQKTQKNNLLVDFSFMKNDKDENYIENYKDKLENLLQDIIQKIIDCINCVDNPTKRTLIISTFLPSGNKLITCWSDGTINIWNTAKKEKKKLLNTFTDNFKENIKIACSDNDNIFATSSGNSVKIWDMENITNTKPTLNIEYVENVYAIAYNKTGTNLAVSIRNQIDIFDEEYNIIKKYDLKQNLKQNIEEYIDVYSMIITDNALIICYSHNTYFTASKSYDQIKYVGFLYLDTNQDSKIISQKNNIPGFDMLNLKMLLTGELLLIHDSNFIYLNKIDINAKKFITNTIDLYKKITLNNTKTFFEYNEYNITNNPKFSVKKQNINNTNTKILSCKVYEENQTIHLNIYCENKILKFDITENLENNLTTQQLSKLSFTIQNTNTIYNEQRTINSIYYNINNTSNEILLYTKDFFVSDNKKNSNANKILFSTIEYGKDIFTNFIEVCKSRFQTETKFNINSLNSLNSLTESSNIILLTVFNAYKEIILNLINLYYIHKIYEYLFDPIENIDNTKTLITNTNNLITNNNYKSEFSKKEYLKSQKLNAEKNFIISNSSSILEESKFSDSNSVIEIIIKVHNWFISKLNKLKQTCKQIIPPITLVEPVFENTIKIEESEDEYEDESFEEDTSDQTEEHTLDQTEEDTSDQTENIPVQQSHDIDLNKLFKSLLVRIINKTLAGCDNKSEINSEISNENPIIIIDKLKCKNKEEAINALNKICHYQNLKALKLLDYDKSNTQKILNNFYKLDTVINNIINEEQYNDLKEYKNLIKQIYMKLLFAAIFTNDIPITKLDTETNFEIDRTEKAIKKYRIDMNFVHAYIKFLNLKDKNIEKQNFIKNNIQKGDIYILVTTGTYIYNYDIYYNKKLVITIGETKIEGVHPQLYADCIYRPQFLITKFDNFFT